MSSILFRAVKEDSTSNFRSVQEGRSLPSSGNILFQVLKLLPIMKIRESSLFLCVKSTGDTDRSMSDAAMSQRLQAVSRR